MDLEDLKEYLKSGNDISYPIGDYDKRERMAKPTDERSVLPIRNVMVRFFYWLDRVLHPACPKCGNGRIHHRRSEWTGRVWIEVYDCDRCGSEFV